MTSRFDKWIKMVDFKLGNEMSKVNWSTRHKRLTKKILRKFWVPDTQTHGRCSIHWAMRTHVFGRVWVQFLLGTQNFLFPSLMSCWSIHLSHFITELKIHHHYSLITTHDDFDSADPTRMQDACHLWTQLNDCALHVAQWIEHPQRVQEVMSLIPVGVSEFSIFIPHYCHVD